MKKCFAITGPFVPTNEPMTLLSYKHLRSLDVFCHVVAQKYTIDESLSKKLDKDIKFKNFDITYLGNYNDALFSIKNVNLIKALYNVKKYIKQVVKMYSRETYDFIYTSSFPAYTIRAAAKIKKIDSKIKWIASFTDPINESPYKKDLRTFKEYSLIEKIAFLVYTYFYVNEKDEIMAFENADILVFICEEQRDFMIEQYLKKNNHLSKMELLNKSVIFPLNYIPEWNDVKVIDCKRGNANKFVLAHFGRVYGLRDATKFIEAVSKLIRENKEVVNVLEIKQFGEFRQSDIKLIKSLELEKIFKIFDKIPYEECIVEMNKADALLIFDTIMPDNEIQPYLPSKVLEYSLIGKNVLTVTSKRSPSYRIAIESNAIIAFNEVDNIKLSLMNLLKGNESKLKYQFTNNDAAEKLKDKVSQFTQDV